MTAAVELGVLPFTAMMGVLRRKHNADVLYEVYRGSVGEAGQYFTPECVCS